VVRINLDKPFKSSMSPDGLQSILSTQKAAFDKNPNSPWSERKANLQKLGDIIKSHEAEFIKAISEDFGHRAAEETILAGHWDNQPVELSLTACRYALNWRFGGG